MALNRKNREICLDFVKKHMNAGSVIIIACEDELPCKNNKNHEGGQCDHDVLISAIGLEPEEIPYLLQTSLEASEEQI